MVRPDNSTGLATTTGPCVDNDDTSQIGCLVKASPCSVGYAGREAADPAAPFDNVALRLTGIQATTPNIKNLRRAGPRSTRWPASCGSTRSSDPARDWLRDAEPETRKLTLSTCMGLPATCAWTRTARAPTRRPATPATGRCFSGSNGIVDTAITAHNFVTVPASVPRLVLNGTGQGCPLP